MSQVQREVRIVSDGEMELGHPDFRHAHQRTAERGVLRDEICSAETVLGAAATRDENGGAVDGDGESLLLDGRQGGREYRGSEGLGILLL